MQRTVQRRRGQGMDVTPEQVAIERARGRVGRELMAATGRIIPVDVIWSPEETEALRATLAGKGERMAR